MPRPVLLTICAALLATGYLSCGARAEDDQAYQERIERLEALLERQQQRIEELERKVAAAEGQELNQQRIELMRQQIREILSEREFRESLMPTVLQVGYDRGFYIRSSDEKFLLKINGRVQFRWTHYATRDTNKYLLPRFQRNDRTGFDIERLRLVFSGHAYNKDLTYHLQIRADEKDRYNVRLHYGYMNYRFMDEFQMRWGVFRLASTRAQVTNDALLQFIDRPVVDAVFGLGIGLGVRFWGRLFDKRLDWYLDVVNALNSPDNRTITPDPPEHDNNPAILFRLVWHALTADEDDPGSEFLYEGDLERHESPALDFGFHYAFNNDDGDTRTTRIPVPLERRFLTGGFGLVSTNGLQINQFGWDAAFKWNGFSALGEYIIRIVDPIRGSGLPIAPWVLVSGQGDTTVQHGLCAGRLLPPHPGAGRQTGSRGPRGGHFRAGQQSGRHLDLRCRAELLHRRPPGETVHGRDEGQRGPHLRQRAPAGQRQRRRAGLPRTVAGGLLRPSSLADQGS